MASRAARKRKVNGPRLDQSVDARLMELRDIARSGVTERTGKSARIGRGEQEERGRKIRGMRSSYPELSRLPKRDTPKKIAEAIDRGKGKIYRRIRATVQRELELHVKEARVRRERPVIAPHEKLTGKCKKCGVMHGRGEHRFHGKDSMARTHLFSFNPRSRRNPAPLPVQIYGNVTRIYLKYGGSYDLERKPKMYGLPGGELLISWRGPRGIRALPRIAVERRYGPVTRIDAQKTQHHRCDAECKRLEHQYYHPFKFPNEMVQLRDGSLVIFST